MAHKKKPHLNKIKEVKSHLHGDIKTFEKEKREDKKLLKKLGKRR